MAKPNKPPGKTPDFPRAEQVLTDERPLELETYTQEFLDRQKRADIARMNCLKEAHKRRLEQKPLKKTREDP